MTNEINAWQDIRNTYLNKVEKVLSNVASQKRKDILSDVTAHLDQKFTELSNDQKTWENFQAIITDMGPAEEYAELLDVDSSGGRKPISKTFVYMTLANGIVVLGIIAAVLLFKGSSAESPDVSIEDFYLVPSSRQPGKFQVIASIHNKGVVDSDKMDVYFYMGDPDKVKHMHHFAGPIKPGGIWNETVTPFNLTDSVHSFTVVVDPDKKTADRDRKNNKATLKVVLKDGKYEMIQARANMVKTDIAVKSLKLRPSNRQQGSYDLIASIHNEGTQDSPQFGVYFYRDDPELAKPMTHAAGPIKPGGEWNEYTVLASLKEGINEFAVVVDPASEVNDPNRSNNKKTLTVTVKDGVIGNSQAQ